MKGSHTRLLAGLLLIAAGALFLLQNLGIFRLPDLGELFLIAFFGLGALAFLSVYIMNRAHWWALIPGAALGGIAAHLALDWLAPGIASAWGGFVFLATLALGFLLIFVTDRQQWWALIPGGVLFTLAVVATADRYLGGAAGGVLFFLGLSATFGAVYLVPTEHGRMSWALIPAGICLVLAFLASAALSSIGNVLWPLGLILFGAYLLLRSRGASKTGAPLVKEDLK